MSLHKPEHPSTARVGDESSTNGHAEIADLCAEKVITKPVEWLWYGRIPRGKLTMFDGDPDLGKSVVTMDIAARKSTGRTFPDGAESEAGNVLIANVEDDVADTIVPRLKAHGADLSRVFIISGVPDGQGGTRLLEIPGDIMLLEAKVLQREAVLLIIDPILTMLAGDANKDQDARKALTPLRDMAERTGVAVIAVRRLNKNVSLQAIQRGGGNMGLIGVARAGAFFAKHPDDEALRVMAQHKSNLAENPPSLAYRMVNFEAVGNVPRVEWKGATVHDANSLAAGPIGPEEKGALEDAKEFLLAELAGGPMWAKQVLKDAREAGIAEKTLYRAKTALRVRSEKHGDGSWAWGLPSEDGHVLSDDHVDHVGHVQDTHSKHTENLPYVREDGQDGQGSHYQHGHDHLGNGLAGGDQRHSQGEPELEPKNSSEGKGRGVVGETPRHHLPHSPAVDDSGSSPSSKNDACHDEPHDTISSVQEVFEMARERLGAGGHKALPRAHR